MERSPIDLVRGGEGVEVDTQKLKTQKEIGKVGGKHLLYNLNEPYSPQ